MKNWRQIFDNKVQGLVDYIEEYDLQALVLGVSGGIDSTLTAAIASEACKKAGIKLIGRSLPTSTNESPEREAAILVGEAFCDDFREIRIEELVDQTQYFIEDFEDMSLGFIPIGNIKARLRMIYLYNLAFMHKGVVLDTDNLTEHYMGFFTIHGDQGDLGVLGDLWKTEVFEFGKWMVDEYSILDALEGDSKGLEKSKAIKASLALNPTDGNGTAPDLEQYGAPSFEIVDKILQALVFNKEIPENKYVEPIKQRFLKSKFKRWHGPLIVNSAGGITDAEGEVVL